MQQRKLSGTNLNVSLICLGTMTFGDQTNRPDSNGIMDYAYEQGVNFFDTADAYNQGLSERIVGGWLRRRRDLIILATKVRNQMGDNPNDSGLNRRHILAAVDTSLNRLRTDYIDIYYLHAPDYETELHETLDTMHGLVQSGKIRYYGVSNYAAWQIADILAVCDRYGLVRPIITQNVYNPITRGIEAELVPFLKAHPMSMTIYNPIAGGLLSGKHQQGKPAENSRFARNKTYFDRYWSEENFQAVNQLGKIAADNNLSILQLAMLWCAGQPQVTSIISGVSRLEQLKQNIAAVQGDPLSAEIRKQCDVVWQGLAGTRFAYNR